jgi:hypothetical protein
MSSRETTDLSSDSPRRYFVDNDGRRVLIGLTFEETFEFEKLDHLPALHASGAHVLWDGLSAAKPAERWLELYAKHEEAWIKWMAETGPGETAIYALLTKPGRP